MKTYNAAGPGRKQCPKCNAYVGVRTNVCECKHEFVNPAPVVPIKALLEPPPEDKEVHPPPRSSLIMKIAIPSGHPPYNLHDLTPDGILEWARKTKAHGLSQGYDLMDSAVLYFARRLFDFNSEEYRMIKTVIQDKGGEE